METLFQARSAVAAVQAVQEQVRSGFRGCGGGRSSFAGFVVVAVGSP